MSAPLDPRAAELLRLLVERYIHDGQPVGSRTLARSGSLDLSPATIRNVMADLDELGLVVSPHTSAGRVPTARGYRYFVDQLLTPEPLGDKDQARISEMLVGAPGRTDELLQTASDLLSQLTAMAAVVTVPRRNLATLRRIEFLPLSGNRVLAILVVNQREVQNRVVHTDRPYGADELEKYANALNEHFAGHDLTSLRRSLLDEAVDAQNRVNLVLKAAATMAAQAMGEQTVQGDYVLAGGANLMGFQELGDVARLRGLFEVLDRKRELLNLFDQCLGADGVQIFIGEESGYRVLDEVSVVTAPYYVDGQVAGRIGVIGPTRMAYSRIIPLVNQTARLFGTGLSDER
ncbi:heat-inducible transcriptional repressor HrcA [Panacagrimonas sp.]|uniref:heat-inducible transcriptional repressor HrcA n=1 Tax=Panacagrimonas sp. TaxID=2480088 RepID=UPI003B52B729